tara:strand:- start:1132 stop:1308 length:177 start_codon:yes stop_codon:yes gene_type:complete
VQQLRRLMKPRQRRPRRTLLLQRQPNLKRTKAKAVASASATSDGFASDIFKLRMRRQT